jgi:hypothetical protein
VIGNGLWRSRFHSDSDIAGITVVLNRHKFECEWCSSRNAPDVAGRGDRVVASVATTRLASRLLVHVSASDPLVFAAAPLFLVAVALRAGYLMHRVTRLERERRDLYVELIAASAHHLIRAVHRAHGSLQRTPG